MVLPTGVLVAVIGQRHGATSNRPRVVRVLIALQIASSLLLTLGGTFVVGSVCRAWLEDPGFPTRQRVFMELSNARNPAQAGTRVTSILAAARSIPGVRAVALMDAPFLQNSRRHPPIEMPSGVHEGRESLVPVAGDFFSLMNLSAVEGRVPARAELEARAPIAVVSESLAKAYWPGRSAVGQVLTASKFMFTVVGVVRDVRLGGLDQPSTGQIYWPSSGGWQRPVIFVETDAPAGDTLAALRGVVATVGAPASALRAMTMTEGLGESIRARRFHAWVFGSFTLAALLVVGTGVFGITAMSIGARTREVGIRLALGASRHGVAGMIWREHTSATAAGILAGIAASAWNVRFAKAYLYHATTSDPLTWFLAIAIVFVVASAGAIVPAMRLSRIDPVRALRAE